MKKFIAVLLCFAVVFCFAACTKNPGNNEEPTGRPGAWVTNADGEVQTVTTPYLVLDENDEPQTDDKGVARTTVVYEILTYPPAEGETLPPQTTAPTVPAGNTLYNENENWPTHDFMSKLPKAADKVDKTTYKSENDGKEQFAAIYINEMKYDDFLAYIKKCQDAGFVKYESNKEIPSKAEAGQKYTYISVANGLYLTISYYTDEHPYRNTDVFISVSNYDMGGIIGTLEGANK